MIDKELLEEERKHKGLSSMQPFASRIAVFFCFYTRDNDSERSKGQRD